MLSAVEPLEATLNASLFGVHNSESLGAFTSISFLELARAAHRAGHLTRSSQPPGLHNEVVAIIANLDTLLYQTTVIGMMRAGIVVSNLWYRTPYHLSNA